MIAWQTEAVVASRILPAVGEPHGAGPALRPSVDESRQPAFADH